MTTGSNVGATMCFACNGAVFTLGSATLTGAGIATCSYTAPFIVVVGDCADGYYFVDPICKQMSSTLTGSGCTKTVDGSVCTVCGGVGKYKNASNACVAPGTAIANCKNYTDATTCATFNDGWATTADRCFENTSSLTKCVTCSAATSATECSKTASGYCKVDATTAVYTTCIANCKFASAAGTTIATCTAAHDGFYIKTDASAIGTCPTGCTTCSDATSTTYITCSACNAGYFLHLD